MAGDDWSREEVEATVGDYFAMLHDELAGLPINKAGHNERLRVLLRNRSKGSVEFKHANISAVLTLHGYPYIDGYKPRFNFQALLEQAVLEYLDVHRDFFEPLIAGPVLSPTGSPRAEALEVNRVVEAPQKRCGFRKRCGLRRPASVDSTSSRETLQTAISDDAGRSSFSSSSASGCMTADAVISRNESNGLPKPEATAPVTMSSHSMRMGARD
jgi:hypothetical protein